jgi:hypothetical protein
MVVAEQALSAFSRQGRQLWVPRRMPSIKQGRQPRAERSAPSLFVLVSGSQTGQESVAGLPSRQVLGPETVTTT